MPGDARLSVDISGRTLGGPSPLQRSTTSAGPASPPDRVEAEALNILVSTILEGPNMVGVPSATLSQQSRYHTTSIQPHGPDRCIPAVVGYSMQEQDNRGTLECGRGSSTHKLLGAQSSNSCLEVVPGRGNSVPTTGPGPASSKAYSSGDGQHTVHG